MKLSSFQFVNDGKSLRFLDKNGKELGLYNSKPDALVALTEFACKKMITSDKVANFKEAIIGNEEFPWTEESKTEKKNEKVNPKITAEVIGMEMFELLHSIHKLGMLGLLVGSTLNGSRSFDHPMFLPCGCVEKWGMIWTRIGFSTILQDEQEALVLLDSLAKIGELDNEDISIIRLQITEFYFTKS